jgi:hypothetical protein
MSSDEQRRAANVGIVGNLPDQEVGDIPAGDEATPPRLGVGTRLGSDRVQALMDEAKKSGWITISAPCPLRVKGRQAARERGISASLHSADEC